jgi:uncharacterized protein
MTQYLRPGAYTERTDAAQSSRLLLRSDVPAFVGIAEKGPLDIPVPIESFRQFQAYFGDFIGGGFLAYSVRAFFDNGGQRCWVVRVASRSFGEHVGLAAQSASINLNNLDDEPVWSIQASSEGSWGNEIEVAMLEENNADAAIAEGDIKDVFTTVSSTAGFVRGSLVRISQEDSAGNLQSFYRVISFVDVKQQRLYWVHPQPGMGLVYDQSLQGFDVNRPARITSITYRIDVYYRQRLLNMYTGLSLVPEHADYAPRRLAKYRLDESRKNVGLVAEVPEPIVVVALQTSVNDVPACLQITSLHRLPLKQGQDGLQALSHTDFIGEEFSTQDSDQQRLQKNRGLASLHQVDEITLLAIPDIVIQPLPDAVYSPPAITPPNPCVPCPPEAELSRLFTPPRRAMEQPPVFSDEQVFQVQAAMVLHCEKRGDRFAVIDPPYHIAHDTMQGIAAIRAWRNRFDSSYAALYYPWVKVIDPRQPGNVRTVPPSGHALGQYALLDNEIGVHRAPANRALQWIQDLSLHTTFGQQELLNPLAINILRSEGSRGIRIMGARTLSSDPDWKFINVRRLLIMVRRVLDIISQWVVFEPNNARTRNKFQVAISSYLAALWSRGALTGANQAQAFYVKCDEENNPGQQRNNGRLLAEIGVAPSQPFEFIILRVGMQENELKISENGGVATAA